MENKKEYSEAQLEIVLLSVTDVIATSGNFDNGGWTEIGRSSRGSW